MSVCKRWYQFALVMPDIQVITADVVAVVVAFVVAVAIVVVTVVTVIVGTVVVRLRCCSL